MERKYIVCELVASIVTSASQPTIFELCEFCKLLFGIIQTT